MAGIHPSAVAGPGPRTLLFGLRFLAAPSSRSLAPSLRPFHTSLLTPDSALPRHKPPRRPRDGPKEPTGSVYTPPPGTSPTPKRKAASNPPPKTPLASSSKSPSNPPPKLSSKISTESSSPPSPTPPSTDSPRPTSKPHCQSSSKSSYKSPSKSTSKSTSKLPAKSQPPPPQEYDDVIFLYPPPDYPIADKVELLRHAIVAHHLPDALAAWSHLVDLNVVSRLSGGDFESVSRFFPDILTQNRRRKAPDLSKMAIKNSFDYGLLVSMAVEAAARDHGLGLYVLSLRLMESGRPADAANAILRCKRLKRDLEGLSEEDLYSWERDTRLAARLDGKDMRSLVMAHLAALTLLDQVDEHALFGMLDTKIDLRPSSKFNFTAIRRVFTTVDRSGQLYVKYRHNLEKLVLAVVCHHTDALLHRIARQSRSQQLEALDTLYERVLEASIGPGAFLRPRSLDESFRTDYRSIALPPSIWGRFITAYGARNDVDRVRTILERDIPARGLQLNAQFLSMGMVTMAIIAQRVHTVPQHVRSKARTYAEDYWQRLGRAGWHMDDGPFASRLAMFNILSPYEPSLSDEMVNLYGAAVAGHLGKIGPRTRSQFVSYFMWRRDFGKALEVFRNLPRDPLSESHELQESVSTMIRHLSKDVWTPKEAFSHCLKVLHLVAETKTPLSVQSLGPLLYIQVNGGLPVQRTVDSILRSTLGDRTQHGITSWTNVLHGLLGSYRGQRSAHTPSRSAFEAGLFILQRASSTQLYGQKHAKEVDMWLAFLLPLARSQVMTMADRHDFMEAALGLFPRGRQNVSPAAWLELIHALVGRKDRMGLASGMAYWNDMVQGDEFVAGWFWSQMLSLLLDAREVESAQAVVKHAWDADKVDLDEGFWLRAQAAGLTVKLGIDVELEARRAELVKGKQWSEPVVQVQTGHYEGGGEAPEDEEEDEALDDLELDYPAR